MGGARARGGGGEREREREGRQRGGKVESGRHRQSGSGRASVCVRERQQGSTHTEAPRGHGRQAS